MHVSTADICFVGTTIPPPPPQHPPSSIRPPWAYASIILSIRLTRLLYSTGYATMFDLLRYYARLTGLMGWRAYSSPDRTDHTPTICSTVHDAFTSFQGAQTQDPTIIRCEHWTGNIQSSKFVVRVVSHNSLSTDIGAFEFCYANLSSH